MFAWVKNLGKKRLNPLEMRQQATERLKDQPRRIDRRSSHRKNAYADVVAMSQDGTYLKRGIVLDLSDRGARVRFENGDSLIDGMVIRIPRHQLITRARMVWRTRTDIGVEFLY